MFLERSYLIPIMIWRTDFVSTGLKSNYIFFLFHFRIQLMQYVIYGIASFFFLYGIILLAEGFYTTSAVKELHGEFKTTACGRCISGMVSSIRSGSSSSLCLLKPVGLALTPVFLNNDMLLPPLFNWSESIPVAGPSLNFKGAWSNLNSADGLSACCRHASPVTKLTPLV